MFDLGYFINYNLKVLEQAYNELKNYIQRKQAEKQMATNYIHLGNINERQAQIIHIYTNKPNEILTVKDLQGRFDISPTTAKQDLIGLVDIGLLNEISLNKIKKGYVKSDKFEEIISSINDRQ
jgi:Fic family protein